MQVKEYIVNLISNIKLCQSKFAREIGISRQTLNNILSGGREISIPTALKIESYFNLSEGTLIKIQAEESMKNYKLNLKEDLFKALLKQNAFWSYSDLTVLDISDEDLIEKVFIYLDLDKIDSLFELYKRAFLKKVWKEKLAVQGDYLMNLNIMIAMYYFKIAKPEKYLASLENKHIKTLSTYA